MYGLNHVCYYSKACLRAMDHEFVINFVGINSTKYTTDEISHIQDLFHQREASKKSKPIWNQFPTNKD